MKKDLTAYVYVGENKSDDWTPITSLKFSPADSNWMLAGKIPEEKDIVPWQEVVLPSGEKLLIGLVFENPEKNIALHVRATDRPVLTLITKGQPCLHFVSPGGTDITIQIHE